MSLEGLFQQRPEVSLSDSHVDRPAAGREHWPCRYLREWARSHFLDSPIG